MHGGVVVDPTVFARPNYDALKAAPTRLVIALGKESTGTFTARAALALAEPLGLEPVVFKSPTAASRARTPLAGQPEAFAQRLREVLSCRRLLRLAHRWHPKRSALLLRARDSPRARAGITRERHSRPRWVGAARARMCVVIAAWYERPGPAAEVLEVGEMVAPEPGAGEVRVRVTLSGVNPGETKNAATGLGLACPSRASFRTAMAPVSSRPSERAWRRRGSASASGCTALSPTDPYRNGCPADRRAGGAGS